jgi:transposase
LVAAVRSGSSQRAVARSSRVSLSTVQFWLRRAGDAPLERVDWSDRLSAPRNVARTAPDLETLILTLRHELKEMSVLGEYGAEAIRRELLARPDLPWHVPTRRTIGRVLARRGALDINGRVRRAPPPRGWYLADLAAREVELDSFDVVDGLYLKGGPELQILTAMSLHGGLPDAWPDVATTAVKAVRAIGGHWQAFGLPAYAQFDNDTRFIGGNRYPDSIGPVIRMCLALGVTPVFAPFHETGFQAGVESFNGRWQAKVWARFWEPSLADLQARSAAYIGAARRRSAVRIEAAPPRRPFPTEAIDLAASPAGRIVFLRRTTETATTSILGHRIQVDRTWPYRLIRADLDLDAGEIRIFALRRREPDHQPLLSVVPYVRPKRWDR